LQLHEIQADGTGGWIRPAAAAADGFIYVRLPVVARETELCIL